MKRALLLTSSIIFISLLAQAQKHNGSNLLDTIKLNSGLFKPDTSLKKLNNKVLIQPFAYKITPNDISALSQIRSISISPVDHMPMVALTSADPMPVKQPDAKTWYKMPIKKLSGSFVPSTHP